MTYYPVQSPYPIFNDEDGTPLEDGYIYIGEAYQNPITNPITARWDTSGLYPAAQPIRTIGGYPDRNGSPGIIYVNAGAFEDYSILVKDKHGNQVYYEQSARSAMGGYSGNSLDIIGDLRSISGYDQPIYVRGHTTIGDGGQGTFEWFDSAAPGTYVDDDGVTIVPTGGDGSGAWLRSFDGINYYPEYYGVDKTAGADASAIFQTIVDLMPKGGILRALHKYRFDDEVSITTPGITIRGPFELAPPKNNAPTSDEFTESYILCNFSDGSKSMFATYGRHITICGLHFYMDNKLTNLITANAAATTNNFLNIKAQHCGGNGIISSTASRIQNCEVFGNNSLGPVAGSIGIKVNTDNFVDNCRCETWDDGIYIYANHAQISNSYSDLSNRGWVVEGTNNKLVNLKAGYNFVAGFHIGTLTVNCRYNNLIGCMAYLNTTYGFRISGGVSDVSLTGCMSGVYSGAASQLYGIHIANNTSNLYINTSYFRSNDTSDVYIDASHTGTIYWVGNDMGQAPFNYAVALSTVNGTNYVTVERADVDVRTVIAGERLNPEGKIILTAASGITLNINPFYSGQFLGMRCQVVNAGSNTITFTHGNNTFFNAVANKVLATHQGFTVMWDGTYWIEI